MHFTYFFEHEPSLLNCIASLPKMEEVEGYKERDEKSLRQTRLVDSKDFPMEVEINLYGGRNVAIMAFGEQMGLIVESRKIYETLKSILSLAGNLLKVVLI